MLTNQIFFINTKEEEEREICRIIEFRKETFLCIYLDVQLEKGIRESKVWDTILEKNG